MPQLPSIFKKIKSLPASLFSWTKRTLIPFARTHKLISIIVLILCVYGGYKIVQAFTSTAGETHYNISRVRNGNISTTVTGTGQVSASNQISLNAKASGAITYVGAHTGDELKEGVIIAKIDTRDIDLSLASARISLQKLTQPVDSTTLIQAQNSLDDANESQEKAELDLKKSYDDALTAVSSTFVDLPEIVNGMNDLLYGSSGFLGDKNRVLLSDTAITYRNTAGVQFDIAKNDYSDTSSLYRTTARSQDTKAIDTLLERVYGTVSKMSDALKNSKLALGYIKDQVNGTYANDATSAQTSVNGWTTKNNTHLSELTSAKNQIITAKNALDSAKRNIREKTESLAKTQAGTDNLDIKSQEINLQQKLLEYENYVIRATFDGVLAKLNVKKNDIVSSGSTVAVFISKQKVADITLNEVDASKVKVGQIVELTFDAVSDVTATGTVASIDLVGTVTQGVVTYNSQITFDTQDERIKPGMSVSAIITTENKNNVLTVPSSAIKVKGGKSYVQVVQATDIVPDSTAIANTTPSSTNASGFTQSTGRNRNRDFASTTGTSSDNQYFNNRNQFSSTSADLGMPFGTSTDPMNASSSDRFNNRGMARSGLGLARLNNVTLLNLPIEREITVGISNDTTTEILSGITEGELIVSKTIAGAVKSATASTPSLLNVGGTGRTGSGSTRPPTQAR